MNLDKYRYWFYAAALYNLVWGTINVLFPDLFFNLINMPPPEYRPIWQVVGMFVLVYAPAYWWAGRYPEKYPHFILIGLLGKIFGPIGFVFSALTNQLPLAFGSTLIFNDLIWWIPFGLYLRDAIKLRDGLWKFLSGE
jgi:small multidrug resistance pump